MDEVFPILAGVVVGLAAERVSSRILRAILIGALAIAFGFAASWLSGELTISWIYFLIDTAQVIAAGVVTMGLVAVWRRRRARRTAG